MNKLNRSIVVSLAVAAALSACSTEPKQIESLEQARTIVQQVETSERAGVAAADIANARDSLDAANRMAETNGGLQDIEFAAQNAVISAQIANEKILTVQAQDEVESWTAQRQAVLLKARERELRSSAEQASAARERADIFEQELADLKAKQTERGLVLTLGDVLFDTAQATLRSGAYATLDRLAKALKDEPARNVMIEGHTDSVGSDESNMRLSERRAQAVQTELLQRGVARNQITAMGKGESFPVSSNTDASGRQQNRRVELIFAENRHPWDRRPGTAIDALAE